MIRHIALTILLLPFLACSPGESSKVRPVGASVSAAAPDTAVSVPQPAPAATTPAKKAQRAWDTAAPESFDVEELNRKRAEPKQEKPFIPLTKADTLKMFAEMKPDEYGAYSYLKPSEYSGLPANIAGWLEERNYVIPQIVPPMERFIKEEWKYQNAIKGAFIRPGQTDWAVYCTSGKDTKIIVFENSDLQSIIVLNKDFDTIDLLNCCDLWINTMAPEPINKYYRLSKSDNFDCIPKVDHNGITLGNAYRLFYILYLYNDHWLVYRSTDEG